MSLRQDSQESYLNVAMMPPADQLWDMDSDCSEDILDPMSPCATTTPVGLTSHSNAPDATTTHSTYPQEQSWHRDYHFSYREQMIQNIIQLIRQLQYDKNAEPPSSNWEEKLPRMVEQLEFILYCSAPTFEAYMDEQTIKHRLQSLAFDMADERDAEDCNDTMELEDQFDGFTFKDC